MEKITTLVTKADFVGVQLKPTLNGRNRVKSFFGGLISIAATICILFGFGYFGMSMIRKDRPIMNVFHRMESNAIIYSKNNPFSFVAYNRFGQMIHNDPDFKRAIQMEIQLYRIRPDPNRIFSLDIFSGFTKACQASDMNETVYKQLRNIGMQPEVAICPDSSSLVSSKGDKYQGDLYLQNRYADNTSDYLYYKVKHCDEQKDPGCGEYLEKAGRISITFYRLDYYIDQTDFTDPIKVNVNQSSYSLSKTVSQTVYVPTKTNEIVTDSSLFLTDESKETYYSAISPSIAIRPYEQQERLLVEFVTSAERIVTINQRRYLKIPELLANMGGFMKAALFIGNCLSFLHSDYIYYVTVKKIELSQTKKVISAPSMLESTSQIKSASPIKIKAKSAQLPSFTGYVLSLFKRKSTVNRKSTFKYLELNYLIDSLLTVEQLKETKQNNFIEQT